MLHGSFHIIQFIQSMFFVAYATHDHDHTHKESFIESVMHNPIFALFMGVIGILTLVIGVKDYMHHRKCSAKHTHVDKVMTLDEEFEITRKKANLLYHKIRERDEPKDNKTKFVFWE